MSRKTFTLTSTHYCRHCGCFDMVAEHSTGFKKYLLLKKPTVECYGCGNKMTEEKMASNVARFLPQTVDGYFFQTYLRDQKLRQKQIKPFTEFLGVSLIAGAIFVLFEFSYEAPLLSQPQIEWAEFADTLSEFHETAAVQALKSELDQVLEKTK